MSTMASQITGVSIVCSTVGSGADQRKHQSSTSLAFVRGIHTGEFPAQKASNVENVSIWWGHYVDAIMCIYIYFIMCHADSHVYTEIFNSHSQRDI